MLLLKSAGERLSVSVPQVSILGPLMFLIFYNDFFTLDRSHMTLLEIPAYFSHQLLFQTMSPFWLMTSRSEDYFQINR